MIPLSRRRTQRESLSAPTGCKGKAISTVGPWIAAAGGRPEQEQPQQANAPQFFSQPQHL